MVFVELLPQFLTVLHEEVLLFTAVPTMSEELGKFAQILEREEREFRRVLQEEVSIFLIPLSLVVNNKIFSGAGSIAQWKEELLNFK